jgi:2-oxoglutarate dehydrogenase complex dehydrogenase (E1) component-like enzyme
MVEVFWQTFDPRYDSASHLTGRIETTKTTNSRLGHGIDAHRGQRRSVSYKQGSKRNVNSVAVTRTIRVYREADSSIGKIDPLEIRSRRNRRCATENDCQLDSAERDREQRTIAAAQFGRVRNQVRRSRRVARQ